MSPDYFNYLERSIRIPVSAYVLINTSMGKAAEAAKEISKISGIANVQCVTGQIYIIVVIVVIESDSINEIGKIVANQIQNASGIVSTIRYPIIDLD